MASFSKNLTYNYIGTFSVSLVGFVTTPFLIGFLGVNSYGAWALLGSFMAYTSLFDFGIGLAGMKLVAEHSLETDRKRINELFSNVVITYQVLSLILLIAGLALLPLLHDIFKVPNELQHQFSVAYVIFLVAATISFSGSSFSGILQGLHDFKAYNRAVIVQALGTTLGVLAVASVTKNLIYMALVSIIVMATVWAYKLRMIYAMGLRLQLSAINRLTIKHIMHFSSAVFVVNVAGRIIFDTDAIIIGIFTGTAAVAAYQVAQNPNTALRKIGDQLNSVTLTTSSKLNANGKMDELQSLYKDATKYSLVIMLPFLVCVCLLAKDFLRTWVGVQFESSYLALIFLSFGVAVVNIQATATQIILSLRQHRTLAIILSVEAVINLVLSIILLKHIGIAGVALGTTIPTLFTALLYTLPHASKKLGMHPFAIFKVFLKPLIAALCAMPVLLVIVAVVRFTNLVEVLLAGLIYAAVYICILIMIDAQVKSAFMKYKSKVAA